MVTGSVVMTTVLNDITYAMAYLIALMEGMNSIVVSDVVMSRVRLVNHQSIIL